MSSTAWHGLDRTSGAPLRAPDIVRFEALMAGPVEGVTQIASACGRFCDVDSPHWAARRRVFRLKRARQC